MDATDVADRAWRGLGVSRWAMLRDPQPPAVLDALAIAVEPEVDRIARLVLDECDVQLDGEARERVVRAVQAAFVGSLVCDVVAAIGNELRRPDPVPFTPPPVAAWIRARRLPRPAVRRLSARPEPTWGGKWHRFTGDLVAYRQVNRVGGRATCGRVVALRDAVFGTQWSSDDGMPSIDYCRQCARA